MCNYIKRRNSVIEFNNYGPYQIVSDRIVVAAYLFMFNGGLLSLYS